MNTLRNYTPSIISASLGVIMVLYPIIAGILVASLLFIFAFLYAFFVRRLRSTIRNNQNSNEQGFYNTHEQPNFKQITVEMFRQTPWS